MSDQKLTLDGTEYDIQEDLSEEGRSFVQRRIEIARQLVTIEQQQRELNVLLATYDNAIKESIQKVEIITEPEEVAN